MDRIGPIWGEFLSAFNIESSTLLRQSIIDPFRRVYLVNSYVYKVVALQFETTSHLREQSLAEEFSILEHCAGIPGVPPATAHYKTNEFEVLVMERLPGETLANLHTSWLQLFIILIKLTIILVRLSWRGISHNDILSTNVLVTSKGAVSLVDFDQASRNKFLVALVRQFTGINIGEGKVSYSLVTTFKECLKKKLPPQTIQFLKKLCGRNDNENIQALPVLPDDAGSQLKMLLKGWQLAQLSDASSPGRRLAYYSLDIEGYHFPGERPWIDRWNTLRSITNYSGKRVLELGCNMALLSCFLLKYSHACATLAVDADAKIIDVAKQISLAFGVKPIFRQQNFDAPNDWETEISDFKPDIVFALSVLNWVQDKKRFIDFLGRFQELIFEGHDCFSVESQRLRSVGFRRIDVISVSERGRKVLHCTKQV